MSDKAEHGYLVLADISGYTNYVATTELEHAHEVLSELLELVVHQLTPALTLSRLQGDAVIAYAPETRIGRGETVLELIEATYVTFRDRVTAMRRGTTCDCRACQNIPTLDLKFITHHGQYIVQNVTGVQELVGTDVNLAHRLLKNGVTEATGWRGYALFTAACLEHMCIVPESMLEQVENYEPYGDIKTYSFDLTERYKELVEARRLVVTPEETDVVILQEVPAPRAVVWDWLNDPQKRTLWEEQTVRSLKKPNERTGTGTVSHCMHGKNITVQTVLDWRPFDYYTSRFRRNSSNDSLLVMTVLEPTDAGTRIVQKIKFEMSPLKRLIFKPMYTKVLKRSAANIDRLVRESYQEEAGSTAHAPGAHSHAAV